MHEIAEDLSVPYHRILGKDMSLCVDTLSAICNAKNNPNILTNADPQDDLATKPQNARNSSINLDINCINDTHAFIFRMMKAIDDVYEYRKPFIVFDDCGTIGVDVDHESMEDAIEHKEEYSDTDWNVPTDTNVDGKDMETSNNMLIIQDGHYGTLLKYI